MKPWMHVFALALFSLLTTACSQRSAEPGVPQQIPGAGLLGDQGDGFAIKGVTFQISPMSIRVCEHPDLRMSADVIWNAQAVGAKTVTIWVDDGSSGPKKWLSGGATGHSRTGAWIIDNASLRLTDGQTGDTLAVRRIHVTQCFGNSPEIADPQSAGI